MPGRTRRVEDERTVAGRRVLGCKILGGPVHEHLVGIPAVPLFAEEDEVPETGGVLAHLFDLFDAFWARDNGHRARVLGPELQVAGPELGGARDGDGPELQEACQDGVPLRHLAEKDHHPVAAAHAHLPRRVREPVGEDRELGEIEASLLAALCQPDHGRPVLRCPTVYHVAPEGGLPACVQDDRRGGRCAVPDPWTIAWARGYSWSSATTDSAAVLPKTRAEARPLAYPPTATPPTSTPAAYRPGIGRLSSPRSTLQPASTARPPTVCVMYGATFTATKGGSRKRLAGPVLGGEVSPPAAMATLYFSIVRRKISRGTPSTPSSTASSSRLAASMTVPPVLLATFTISPAVRSRTLASRPAASRTYQAYSPGWWTVALVRAVSDQSASSSA